MGEVNGKGTADLRGALDGDPSLVSLGDVLHDGKTQPRPPELAIPRFVHPIETLEEPGDVLFLYTASLIGDADRHLLRVRFCLDRHSRARFTIFNGIVDQVHDSLLNEGIVYLCGDIIRAIQLKGDVLAISLPPAYLCCFLEHIFYHVLF